MYKCTYEPPNDLRLRPLENREILVKSQNPMGTQPSVQSPLLKEILALALKNIHKQVLNFFCIV